MYLLFANHHARLYIFFSVSSWRAFCLSGSKHQDETKLGHGRLYISPSYYDFRCVWSSQSQEPPAPSSDKSQQFLPASSFDKSQETPGLSGSFLDKSQQPDPCASLYDKSQQPSLVFKKSQIQSVWVLMPQMLITCNIKCSLNKHPT